MLTEKMLQTARDWQTALRTRFPGVVVRISKFGPSTEAEPCLEAMMFPDEVAQQQFHTLVLDEWFDFMAAHKLNDAVVIPVSVEDTRKHRPEVWAEVQAAKTDVSTAQSQSEQIGVGAPANPAKAVWA